MNNWLKKAKNTVTLRINKIELWTYDNEEGLFLDGRNKNSHTEYIKMTFEITDKSVYKGDATLDNQFDNRDPRLLQTIVPVSENFFANGDGDKTLPRIIGAPSNYAICTTGYHIIKYYDDDETFRKDILKCIIIHCFLFKAQNKS